MWCPESDHFFRKDRKDGTFPRSLPHCAGCWSPARDEGASGSSSRYCGYSSIFRLVDQHTLSMGVPGRPVRRSRWRYPRLGQLTESEWLVLRSQPAGAGASGLSLPVGKDQMRGPPTSPTCPWPGDSSTLAIDGTAGYPAQPGVDSSTWWPSMDWHSRYVVAWRLSNSLEADFCVDAPQGIRITTLSHVGNTTLAVYQSSNASRSRQ